MTEDFVQQLNNVADFTEQERLENVAFKLIERVKVSNLSTILLLQCLYLVFIFMNIVQDYLSYLVCAAFFLYAVLFYG